MTGGDQDCPVPAHALLPIDVDHFRRWLGLSQETASEVCLGHVAVEQLQPIRLPGPKHEDRPGERALARLFFAIGARLLSPFPKSIGFVPSLIRRRLDGTIMGGPA
jgi:hypothetical protein